ncbi:MAG: flavin-containing monooxygenase [Minwuia sp.]|uniref:flavin-containing monooxygenase n=1 Tax=Minwuia sp. TaxID=2493630 RepID=UPI003A86EC54
MSAAEELNRPARADLRFAVIGAGMSGLLAAIKLEEAGFRQVEIFEREGDLGGTWRDNTYPGLSCDVPSHVYRYRFAPNPHWTRRFSSGGEIWQYLDKVARDYGVRDRIRFNSEIVRAEWDGAAWQLTTKGGETEIFDIVITATGVLRDPVMPDIPGLEDFERPVFHSARWDHSHDWRGKRMGLIGTGSTAIQITAAVAKEVGKLSLFQRTAQWVVPVENPEISEREQEALAKDPKRMEELYFFLADRFQNTFARAVVGDAEELAKVEKACEENLATVKDPELRAKLTPNYQAACKRLIMSDTFYEEVQRDTVEVVTEGIERIERNGVRTKDGRLHEIDLLVCATGFEAHKFMRPMQIVGRDGHTLDEEWAEANRAYRSIGIPGFPNFFTIVGPNSPIGNFSLIMISEMQFAYIMRLVDRIASGEAREIEPSREATDRFNGAIADAMTGTVWVSGCSSWYLDRNGNPAMWPWDFERFEEEMAEPDFNDFRIVS